MVIVRPGSQHFDWVLIFPLVLILTNSGFQLLTSRMARTEDPVTMNVLTGWVGTALGAFLLPFVWELPTEWFVWAQLLLMGSFATVGHYLLILAFSKAPATVLTPYFYTQIVFAMLGGWLIFDHMPDHWTLVGIGMVTLCGALGCAKAAFKSCQLNLDRLNFHGSVFFRSPRQSSSTFVKASCGIAQSGRRIGRAHRL
jgi:drug/metabolite transporter (DMT)-like permease